MEDCLVVVDNVVAEYFLQANAGSRREIPEVFSSTLDNKKIVVAVIKGDCNETREGDSNCKLANSNRRVLLVPTKHVFLENCSLQSTAYNTSNGFMEVYI